MGTKFFPRHVHTTTTTSSSNNNLQLSVSLTGLFISSFSHLTEKGLDLHRTFSRFRPLPLDAAAHPSTQLLSVGWQI